MGQLIFQGRAFTLYPLTASTDVSVKTIQANNKNRFGTGPFCSFEIPAQIPNQKRGLYIIVVDGSVRYLGRCLTNFPKRLSEYGHIAPSNCYKKNGQPTNCHINAALNASFKSGAKVEIGICPIRGKDEAIKAAEQKALDGMRQNNPYWNLNY